MVSSFLNIHFMNISFKGFPNLCKAPEIFSHIDRVDVQFLMGATKNPSFIEHAVPLHYH